MLPLAMLHQDRLHISRQSISILLKAASPRMLASILQHEPNESSSDSDTIVVFADPAHRVIVHGIIEDALVMSPDDQFADNVAIEFRVALYGDEAAF